MFRSKIVCERESIVRKRGKILYHVPEEFVGYRAIITILARKKHNVKVGIKGNLEFPGSAISRHKVDNKHPHWKQ